MPTDMEWRDRLRGRVQEGRRLILLLEGRMPTRRRIDLERSLAGAASALAGGDETVGNQLIATLDDQIATINGRFLRSSGDDVELVVATQPLDERARDDRVKLSIGRSPSNHVIINDLSISRHHCFIILEGNEIELFDLESANGTYVRSAGAWMRAGSRVRLRMNDDIRLGNYTTSASALLLMHNAKLASRRRRSRTGVFLSYRREGAGHAAGRLRDHLLTEIDVGDLFIDVDAIAAGDNFGARIRTAMSECAVALVLIDSKWITHPGWLRFWQRGAIGQHIREEVEAAIEFSVPIVPVLVDRALMPSRDQLPRSMDSLHALNAVKLRSGADFRLDAGIITEAVRRFLPDKVNTQIVAGEEAASGPHPDDHQD